MTRTSRTQPTIESDSSQLMKGMESLWTGFSTQEGQSNLNQSQQWSAVGGGGCGVVTEENDKLRIRYLTPRECFRLMAFDDPEIDRIIEAVKPKTQLYKLAGNSIAVCCLEAIFREIYLNDSFDNDRKVQKSLMEFEVRAVNPIIGRTEEEIESETSEDMAVGQ